MFRSRKLLWLLLTLSAITLSTAIVRSQQNQTQGPPPSLRIEDRKPYKRWEWAYRQRAYPGNEIPAGALESADRQLQQWESRFQKRALLAATGRWVNLGPAPITGGQTADDNQTRPVSGRVTDVAVDPTNATRWLIGTAQGGVWETRDAGTTWTPLTDDQDSLAIGAIAFAPSNPQIIYAGTGEAPLGGGPYAGMGLLKSIDGGKTWQLLAQAYFAGNSFSDIKVDPKNPQTVVAALVSGPNKFGATRPPAQVPAGGVFKSTNGGVDWNRSLGLNSFATDLEPDPSDFNRQYAALGFQDGSPNNGVYRSINAGSDWALVNGPTATWTTKPGGVGRVELAIAPSDPKVLYVSIQDANNSTPQDNQLLGLWRTDDAWATPVVWEELNIAAIRAGEPRGQFNYDHEIIVDVTKANTLYVGGVHIWKTPDAKASPIVWEQVDNKPNNALHVDQHTMAWAQPPPTATASLDKLPMSFEPNQGQAEAAVQFQSRGAGYHLQLRDTEAVLQLRKSQSAIRNPQSAIVKMKLIGASQAPRISGQNELPGKSNYLVGNDPQKWRTGIPNYATVKYDEVWPGIDLAYYGNQQQLEYDFILAPGAHPKQIKLGFRGARKLSLKRNGDLVLRTGGGQVRMHKPLIYQTRDGVRKEIRGRYVRRGNRQIGFQVAAYDRSLPLVIDPVLVYSTYLGGGLTDRGRGVAVDSTGKIYLAGETFSTDFPRTVGPSGLKGGLDVFVTKIDPAKTGADSLVYSTYIGGSNGDEARDIAVDSSGRAYVGGNTQSSDFPTAGTADPYKGRVDAFVLRLNAAGSALEYSTHLGTIGDEVLFGLALDSAGNAYVTGTLNNTFNFPATVEFGYSIPNRPVCFITKFNTSGARVYSAVFLGNLSTTLYFNDIAVDNAGNAYVTGFANGPISEFPGAQRIGPLNQARSTSPVFLAKLNAAGTEFAYFSYFGSLDPTASINPLAIAVDAAASAYITGSTSATDFPVVNPAQATPGGKGDAFVAKFNAAGNALLYATFLGGSGQEGFRGGGAGIAVDAQGSAYVTGDTDSLDFPKPNAVQPAFGGGTSDAFVTKLSPDGSTFVYSTYLGGNGVELGNAIAIDSVGSAYIAGTTVSTNFPTKNALQPNSRSAIDAFVTKISEGEPTPARLIVGNDGGVWSSPDGGQTWADHNTNLSITQFYNGSLHPANGNAALGAGQDNGTAYWTGTLPWRQVFSGDGATSAFSSANPNTHWMLSAQNLTIARTTDGGMTPLTNPPNQITQQVDGGITRTAANTPFIAQCVKCPNNDNLFLAGTDSIWSTDNFFSSAPGLPRWTQETASIGGLISAIAFAPVDNACGTWAYGSNTGQLRLTPDDGLTVRNIGAANLPNRYLTDLAFHPYDANILYATFSGFDELTPGQAGHLFKTTNALAVNPIWTNVSPPMNIPLNAVAVDPSNPEIVYVGADIGVWKSVNGGTSWEHYGPDKGMPKITVYDLQINSQTDRVIAFTHGRGAFALERNRADLALTKTASPNPVVVNQNLTYTLTVKNNGPDKATEIFLRDTLPPGATYVSSNASQGFCAGNAVSVNCQLGELNNGATATITIVVKPTQPGNITNMAQVSSDEFDPNFTDNKATFTTQVIAPDLAVTKSHTPLTVFAGQNFNYAITVKNNGLADATGVVATDTLPAGVVFVSATASQGSCTGTATVICNLGGLAKGVTTNLTLVVRAATTGAVTNVVTATASEPDANPNDNRALDTLTISAGPAITRITPAAAAPGTSDLELKIEGTNFVPGVVISFQPATGIDVLPVPPIDLGFISPIEIRRRITLRADAPSGERQMFVTNPNGASGGERPFNLFTVIGGPAAIETSPANLDFASVMTGQSKDLTLTARNTGQAGLTINPIASSNSRFSVIAPALPVTLAAGAQQALTVRFAPTVAGSQTGTLTINSNAANRPSLAITLSGTGVGAPGIAVAPATLDFGNVTVGQRILRTLTLSNAGSAPLNVYGITSSNPAFSVALPAVPFTVQAGATGALTASFTPTAAGVQTATLLVTSNVADKNPLALPARGTTPGGQPIEILATDDGTVETGAQQDGLIMLNRLTPLRYPVTLRSLRIFFAQYQGLPSPVGEQIKLLVFLDPLGSGQPPINPRLLVNQNVTIPTLPANGGFIEFPVTANAAALLPVFQNEVTIESGDLYVGFQAPRPANGVVFAADSNGPQQQRAFFSTNDGGSYVKLTGLQNQQGVVTPVNLMMQGSIGGLNPCSYSINPTNQVFAESGGSGTVTITAPSGCNWAADSLAGWITFQPNSNGSANGTVGFSVAAGTTPRQAIVTVAGLPFTVAQAEKVASVSGASYRRSGLASEAIASAYGLALASTTQSAAGLPLPTSLAGTSVKVLDAVGTELFAPLFFASPNQLNFLMPPGVAPGTVTVTVNNNGITSVGAALNDVVAPGIFTANADGQGVPAALALRVKADGSQSIEPVMQFDATQQRFIARPIELGPAGEQVFLILFGTGIRYRSALSAVAIKVGNINAEVSYTGPQGDYLGLDQINLVLPRSLAGRGEVDIVLLVEGKEANTVRVNLK